MSRQEKLSAPVRGAGAPAAGGVAQATRRGLTASAAAWRATAASRSRRASRLRKSATRRGTCGASPATQRSGPRRSPPSRRRRARPADARCDGRRRAAAAISPGAKAIGLRQPRESYADPGRVTLGELPRGLQRTARRHGQQHVARGRAHAQRIAARGRDPAQRDAVSLAGVGDLKLGRRPAVEEGEHGQGKRARGDSPRRSRGGFLRRPANAQKQRGASGFKGLGVVF